MRMAMNTYPAWCDTIFVAMVTPNNNWKIMVLKDNLEDVSLQ
jgi:hypothetical protein